MPERVCLVYISAGSNLGDRRAHLEQGLRALGDSGVVPTRISSVFETEPVDAGSQPWFLNIALEAKTQLSPGTLLERCLAIELEEGRSRPYPNAPRTLDLDILLYGDRIIHTPRLTIPHPRMVTRRFVLEPLAEIAPDLCHPVLKKTIRALLAACPDSSAVRLYSPGEPR